MIRIFRRKRGIICNYWNRFRQEWWPISTWNKIRETSLKTAVSTNSIRLVPCRRTLTHYFQKGKHDIDNDTGINYSRQGR